MPLYKCQVCNFVFEGPQPPDRCPKCGAPRERFTLLSDQEAELIKRSRKSNYLHMRAASLLREFLAIADELIQENLDPPCVRIANEEKDFALTTLQKITAELESHMKKGRWG
ncbi:MAG: rubredoxin [Ignisphaera sp.]|nr:rubredoxin [Ignisphaera sp.]MDW8085617.1 rubredoxin [Ignisphaera sp.]